MKVIYQGRIYEVAIVYSHHLELKDGRKRFDVKFGAEGLIVYPTKAQLASGENS